MQPVPFGPKFKYPDLRQSPEKLCAELRQLCTTEVEQLLGFFDTSGLLRRLVRTEYQGDDPQSEDALFFDEAPFFYLALDNNEALREVHKYLLEASEVERFVALYFIRTWMVYLRDAFHVLQPDNATQQELNNYGYTELLWKEFGAAYNDTLFLCRCGLVLTQRSGWLRTSCCAIADSCTRQSWVMPSARQKRRNNPGKAMRRVYEQQRPRSPRPYQRQPAD